MTTKQVRFCDDEGWHGGILVEGAQDGDFIICGCCGGIIPLDEIDDPDFNMVPFPYWVDLNAEILGEWSDASIDSNDPATWDSENW